MRLSLKDRALKLLLPTIIFGLWELFAEFGALPEDTFSRPSDIGKAAFTEFMQGSLAQQTVQTLAAAATAVLLAFAIGLPLGLFIGFSERVRRATNLIVGVLRSVPPIALTPIVLMIFGFSMWTDVAVSVWSCVWIILIATSAAVRQIDIRAVEVAHLLGVSLIERMRSFVLPAMLPSFFTAFRLTVSVAFVMVVTCEIAANPRGLGFGMIEAQQTIRPDILYAKLFWLGVVGWSIDLATSRLQRRLFFWA